VQSGDYTAEITGLTPEAHYYVRAYFINAIGTGYGAATEFYAQASALSPADLNFAPVAEEPSFMAVSGPWYYDVIMALVPAVTPDDLIFAMALDPPAFVSPTGPWYYDVTLSVNIVVPADLTLGILVDPSALNDWVILATGVSDTNYRDDTGIPKRNYEYRVLDASGLWLISNEVKFPNCVVPADLTFALAASAASIYLDNIPIYPRNIPIAGKARDYSRAGSIRHFVRHG
jgi:hypothetical protein